MFIIWFFSHGHTMRKVKIFNFLSIMAIYYLSKHCLESLTSFYIMKQNESKVTIFKKKKNYY